MQASESGRKEPQEWEPDYAEYFDFPSFAPMFRRDGRVWVVLYLPLLVVYDREAEAQIALWAVRRAAAQSANAEAEVVALLDAPGWHPNLIGAAAIAQDARLATPATLSALWNLFDRGSWVTPQLAVTAFLRDPDFAEHAHHRIGMLSQPCDPDDLVRIYHRPANWRFKEPKSLSALVYLYEQLPPERQTEEGDDWLAQTLTAEDRRKLKEEDRWDGGDDIAAMWLKDFPIAAANSQHIFRLFVRGVRNRIRNAVKARAEVRAKRRG